MNEDSRYAAGVRETVDAVVDYGLASLEHGDGWSESIPKEALRQAKLAARKGVSVETILRRYTAGERLLADFIVAEAHDVAPRSLRNVLTTQRLQIDQIFDLVAATYTRERQRLETPDPKHLEHRVEQLLAGNGEPRPSDVDYPFDGWHVGLIVTDDDPATVARSLAAELNQRYLVVTRSDRVAWAWLGSRSQQSMEDFERALRSRSGPSVSLGEPRQGIAGWRHTHSEAIAAFEVMQRQSRSLVRASEVLLLAALLRDEVLARSLAATYMAPLDEFGNSAPVLRETLRAYLRSGRNAVTAAAALEVDRHTVHRRLRKIEEAIKRPLHDCHGELEVALELERLADAERAESFLGAPHW